MEKIEPEVLEGRSVRLEPLEASHAPSLAEAAQHDELWTYMPFRLSTREDADGWVQYSRQLVEHGTGVIYATIARANDQLVGSTAFLAASPSDSRIEIGATWVVPAHQRTIVNTEAKYLMLRHAFERWGCLRVEFKTDARNAASRAALARIGAVEEGTLRSHMRMPDGRRRDSVYFSVIEPEWPGVRAALEARLAA